MLQIQLDGVDPWCFLWEKRHIGISRFMSVYIKHNMSISITSEQFSGHITRKDAGVVGLWTILVGTIVEIIMMGCKVIMYHACMIVFIARKCNHKYTIIMKDGA